MSALLLSRPRPTSPLQSLSGMKPALIVAALFSIFLLVIRPTPAFAAAPAPAVLEAQKCMVVAQDAAGSMVSDSYDQGFAAGTAAGNGVDKTVPYIVGCGSACGLYLVGACGAWAAYRFLPPPKSTTDLSGSGPEYRRGYEDGYKKAARKTRALAALSGAGPALLIGSALLVITTSN